MSENNELKFVSVNYDDMEEKTTYAWKGYAGWETGGTGKLINWKQIRQVKPRRIVMKDMDSLVLDGHYHSSTNAGWFFLRNGELTINIDSKLHKFKFNETNTDVEVRTTDSGTKTTNYEYGYWEFDKKTLKAICEADVVKVRVSGKGTYFDAKEEEIPEFVLLCQRFYNEVYDDTAFVESLELTEEEKKSGCFVATATMGHYDHPTVLELRRFRDGYLRNSVLGRAFIKTYYKVGPYPAAVIRKSAFLRKVSLSFIIEPLRKVASKLYKG